MMPVKQLDDVRRSDYGGSHHKRATAATIDQSYVFDHPRSVTNTLIRKFNGEDDFALGGSDGQQSSSSTTLSQQASPAIIDESHYNTQQQQRYNFDGINDGSGECY
jgi:hypothetical protein